MTAIEKITQHAPDARPVQNTASFQGLSLAVFAPIVIPLMVQWLGIPESDATLIFQYFVTSVGAGWALYGILRRHDVKLPWKK